MRKLKPKDVAKLLDDLIEHNEKLKRLKKHLPNKIKLPDGQTIQRIQQKGKE